MQFLPQDPSKVIVTCADSLVRILSGINVIGKYRGMLPSRVLDDNLVDIAGVYKYDCNFFCFFLNVVNFWWSLDISFSS